jgi:hypothetical protein
VLPDVYRRVLPACEREARERGDEAWATFIAEEVERYIGGAVRRVTSHIEEYVALCEDECTPAPATLDAVPFEEERFLAALYALAGSEAAAEDEA